MLLKIVNETPLKLMKLVSKATGFNSTAMKENSQYLEEESFGPAQAQSKVTLGRYRFIDSNESSDDVLSPFLVCEITDSNQDEIETDKDIYDVLKSGTIACQHDLNGKNKIMSPMLENNEVNFTINDDDSDEVTTWRFTKNLGWKKYNEFSEVVGEQSIVVENDPKPFHWVDKEIEKLKVQLGNLQQCLDVNSLKESSVMAREISDKIELLHKATRFAQFEENFSALAPSDMMMNEHDILVEA